MQHQEYTLEPARFHDYRDFIKFRYESLKEKNKKFSLQAFAQKSGLSKSLIQFLLKKQRHLGLDNMPKLAQSLKMTEDEEYFVYMMVCMESSKNKRIREHFHAILGRIRHQHLPRSENSTEIIANDKPENQKALHADILPLVLQTMPRLKGFEEDPEWIAQNLMIPNIDVARIKPVLQDLEKKELIVRDKNKRLQSKGHFAFTADAYDPNGMNLYTKTSQVLADLMKTPKAYKPSIYMQLMLAMDEENLKKAELLMVELHQRLSEMAKQSTAPTAAVYFGNYMLTVARLK